MKERPDRSRGLLLPTGTIYVSQLALDLLDAGQAGLKVRRQGFKQLEFRYAHWLCLVAQGVFGDDLVLAFAEKQANGRIVVRAPPLAINCR